MLTTPRPEQGRGPAPGSGEALPTDHAGLDVAQVSDLVRGQALRPGPVGRVGLELERHVIDLAAPRRRVGWDRLTAVTAGARPPSGSRVTLEPGGQVELSTRPEDGVVAAVEALRQDASHLDEVFAADGLVLLSTGTDPVREPRRVHPGSRYVAMAEHFAAAGHAADGAVMMCSTASLQVNLDAGPRPGWVPRLQRLDALVPVLVALSACSPLLAGTVTGSACSRQRVWQRLEPGRCVAPSAGAGGDDPAGDWAEFALAAPVMFVRAASGEEFSPVTEHVSLADWASGRQLLGGRRPTARDVEDHLSTLWPPVRLRGFLELRVLDAVPAAWWPGLAAIVSTVVDDEVAGAAALDAATAVAGRAADAAHRGLSDPDLARAARGVVAAALDAVPPALRPEVEAWADLVAAGRTPGDLVTDRARRDGAAACLTAEELR